MVENTPFLPHRQESTTSHPATVGVAGGLYAIRNDPLNLVRLPQEGWGTPAAEEASNDLE
jgi:hypothetical protein